MSAMVNELKEPQGRIGGALWASPGDAHHHRYPPMALAIAGAVLLEVLVVVGLTHMHFDPPPPPPKEMRVTMAPPPPPPPPPVVKKLEPPPAPKPEKTQPKPQPKPARPQPVPQPPKIAAAAHPEANAPAVATTPATSTPAPPTAPVVPAAPPAPAPAPGLHGVVDGRGHCQSVQPVIPHRALAAGVSADVVAHLTIGTDGNVSDVKIVRVTPPTSMFNEAVITAGKSYRCEKNPEPYVGEVTFSFKTTASSDDD
jgi:protein TonB